MSDTTTPMRQTKNPLASSAVWGGLIAAIAGAIGAIGLDGPQEIPDLAVEIASVIGGILAIIGRIRATKRISL